MFNYRKHLQKQRQKQKNADLKASENKLFNYFCPTKKALSVAPGVRRSI